MDDLKPKKNLTWPVIALMSFVTVIGFDDIIYNFKAQGLGVITSWILMLLLFVVPYEMMVGQLGSVFSSEGGGLASWMRGTSGDRWGYITAWTYWAASLPYMVDIANTMVVSFGWVINGNGSMQDKMPNSVFALLTVAIFIVFVLFQHKLSNPMELLSTIGGGAMFVMTILFVILAFVFWGQGHPAATQPFTPGAFIPKFDLHYLTTLGMLVFAMNGAEYVAPYVSEMKNGKRDFPKAMWMLAIMTGFLTIAGSFALGIFFNAHNLPNDMKMNGSYYAFAYLDSYLGTGRLIMYTYAITQAIYMMAQLAVFLDGGARLFIADTSKKYLPKVLTKIDKRTGLPINGYWLTVGICAVILGASATLPSINDIFNQLLNLNGIVSPYVTGFVFWAFIKIRKNEKKFPSEYVYIKNSHIALTVGWWCLLLTLVAATFGILPLDAKFGTDLWYHTLFLNIAEPLFLVALGGLLPMWAKWEQKRENNNSSLN